MSQEKTSDESVPGREAGLQPWIMVSSGALAALMTFVALLWNIEFFEWLGFAFVPEQYYAIIMGLALAVVFMTIRINRGTAGPMPWYDGLLVLGSLVVMLYVGWDFLDLKEREYSESTDKVIVLGAIITLLVIDGLRRSAGYVILGVVGVFLIYAPLGHLVPGQLIGMKIELWKLAVNIGFNPNALFGVPLQVGTTIVIMFILMGQVLFKAGGGQFFTDLAMATMGRRRGGAAKISVMASALFGTISGTAVSNVVTTGIITIPLMRQAGYRATHAGAIEAIASTGGQFMPPIMGAAAFLMAEFLEIPYAEIVIAALIPSLLYYFAVFIQVDLIAARDNISVVEQDLPKIGEVLKEGWHFVVPFMVLIYSLFELNMPPAKAAIYSALVIVIGGMFRDYKGARLRVSELYDVFVGTGKLVIELLMIVSSAGFVIGILNLSGLGFALTLFLVDLAGGSLWVLLVIGAMVCIVLGMGMPTTVVYILLAALVAPAIVEAGVAEIPAHMFILYFGMMSMITPPIALAAFAAATLSKADPMITGFVAMRFGWVAYVVPFLFVLSPTLLLIGDPGPVALNVATAVAGVYLISVAVVGYFSRPLNWGYRLMLSVAGIAAMLPDVEVGLNGFGDAFGVLVGGGFLVREFLVARHAAAVAEQAERA
ncbi:MAG: TRAP transporter fused permease subunit [Alphaproteobacteria bacterium]|nr:TRAP transporter fused permease subunit [Alphaproteobacteria bacterium]